MELKRILIVEDDADIAAIDYAIGVMKANKP